MKESETSRVMTDFVSEGEHLLKGDVQEAENAVHRACKQPVRRFQCNFLQNGSQRRWFRRLESEVTRVHHGL